MHPGIEHIMSYLKKLLFVAALLVVSSSSVATAGAAVATVTAGPTVSGTATTSTLLKLHTASKTLSCLTATMNGTVAASTTGSIPPGFRIGTVTPAFATCHIVGGLGLTVKCQPAALNVNGLTAAGRTASSIGGVDCHFFITTMTACRVRLHGTWAGDELNGAVPVPPEYEIDPDHGSLVARESTNGMGGACSLLPNDASVRMTDPSAGSLRYAQSPTNLNVQVTP
jgi:hypothetical protein